MSARSLSNFLSRTGKEWRVLLFAVAIALPQFSQAKASGVACETLLVSVSSKLAPIVLTEQGIEDFLSGPFALWVESFEAEHGKIKFIYNNGTPDHFLVSENQPHDRWLLKQQGKGDPVALALKEFDYALERDKSRANSDYFVLVKNIYRSLLKEAARANLKFDELVLPAVLLQDAGGFRVLLRPGLDEFRPSQKLKLVRGYAQIDLPEFHTGVSQGKYPFPVDMVDHDKAHFAEMRARISQMRAMRLYFTRKLAFFNELGSAPSMVREVTMREMMWTEMGSLPRLIDPATLEDLFADANYHNKTDQELENLVKTYDESFHSWAHLMGGGINDGYSHTKHGRVWRLTSAILKRVFGPSVSTREDPNLMVLEEGAATSLQGLIYQLKFIRALQYGSEYFTNYRIVPDFWMAYLSARSDYRTNTPVPEVTLAGTITQTVRSLIGLPEKADPMSFIDLPEPEQQKAFLRFALASTIAEIAQTVRAANEEGVTPNGIYEDLSLLFIEDGIEKYRQSKTFAYYRRIARPGTMIYDTFVNIAD